MSTRNPVGSARRAPRAAARRVLAAVVLACVAGALGAYGAYGVRPWLRAAFGGGYAHWDEFPLRDSLPALEGGLSGLEAFKVTVMPYHKADEERAIWLSDTLGRVRVEYVSERQPFDSVQVLSWSTGRALQVRTFTDREFMRDDSVSQRMAGWTEVVTVYVSFPPLLTFRSADPRIRIFEPAEGKVLHVVKGRYVAHARHSLQADTSYPVPDARDSEVQVVGRGDALAIINPSPRAVVLGLVDSGRKGAVTMRGEPGRVTVYRTALRGRTPPVLAYSDPGVPFPVFRERETTPRRFFVWMPDSGRP